ncbi:DUF1343 domain-containing protein [Simiduia sp. 21SJ11W-1]|uniref:exo-beta-N-acetylmuramidase NamZ family protein n=1 Tax=Simiduia sp. 21SJ11W-1 TaxID=2909669 RepID=UPI00209E3995|nr:DUF1343 domain-containing protein [Simiduia sp. 21SJ11W-1]UTA48409.1 DUF1343 domain-containing protein [Simiduia sp. 21SJ11W-1]
MDIVNKTRNALAGLACVSAFLGAMACSEGQVAPEAQLRVGAEQPAVYQPLLAGKALGLVVNQTSRVGERHLIDVLLSEQLSVKKVFALEHGVRGNVENGGHVSGGVDAQTGLPIVSLYGGKYGPDASDVSDLDWLVFDIQDVGVRYYTYISSLHYLMQACADFDVPLLVLDRPNPNGDQVGGPVLQPEFKSFVGMHPIPLVHGLTVGELAHMINGEGWLDGDKTCALTVVPVAGYHKAMHYSLPVRPSPNLPNDLSVRLYPSLGFFEGTDVSIGRGTDAPFQIIGHPQDTVGELYFTPVPKPGASENPKHKGVQLRGDAIALTPAEATFTIDYVVSWYQRLGLAPEAFFNRAAFFDKLAGTDALRKAIVSGATTEAIESSWAADIAAFKQQRAPYLLYPEN